MTLREAVFEDPRRSRRRGAVRSALLSSALLTMPLVPLLPTPSAGEEIASGIQFIPSVMSSSNPNRSQIVVTGPHVIFNDGSAEPLKRTSRSGGLITPLATSLGTPLSVVVRGGFAYSSSGCTIFRTALADATTTVVTRTTQCDEQGHIAVDDVNVYFVTFVASPNTWTIRSVPVGGGSSVPLVSTGKRLRGLATDGAMVFWEEERYPDPGGPQSSVRAVPVGGGTPVDLATGLRALRGGLALRGTDLFFADVDYVNTYRLMKVPAGGGPVTMLAIVSSPDLPTDIAADDTRAYWTIKGAVKAVSVGGGGAVETLAPGLESPSSLVLASGELYWTEILCCTTRANGVVKKVPIAGGPVTVLATMLESPSDMDADASHVLWVEGGAYGKTGGYGRVVRLPLAGGEPFSLADTGPGVLPPFDADDTNVYFANRFSVKKVPLTGGRVENLATGSFYIEEVVTDGTDVYWIEGPGSVVHRVSVNGGPATIVGNGGFGPPGPLALDDANAYFVDHFDKILKSPKGGGSQVTLASGLPFLSDLVTDGTELFFSQQDSGAVVRMSVDGGPASFVTASEGASQVSLALDQQLLYWIGQSRIVSVPKTGGSAATLAQGLASTILVPNGLALDHRGGVYWTEAAGGTIEAHYGMPPVTSLAFAGPASAVLESAGVALVRVQLTTSDGNPLPAPASAQFTTVNGSGLAGIDYTPSSGTLTVPAATPSGTLLTIPIAIFDDLLGEGTKTFSVVLSNPAGAVLEPPTSQIVAILDDDPPQPPTLHFFKADLEASPPRHAAP